MAMEFMYVCVVRPNKGSMQVVIIVSGSSELLQQLELKEPRPSYVCKCVQGFDAN